MSTTQPSRSNVAVQVTSLILGFIIVINLLAGNQVWPLNSTKPRAVTFSDLLSPESLNALYEDPQFQMGVQSLIQVAADTTKTVAEHSQSEALQKFSDEMELELVKLRSLQAPKPKVARRGVMADIGSLLTQAGTKALGEGSPALGGILGSFGAAMGMQEKAQGGGGGIAGLLGNALNGIVGALAGPAFFLGGGLGGGAATGLKLTTAQQADAQTKLAAKQANLDPGGINGVAANLGSGLTSVIVPLVPVGALQAQIAPVIGGAAFSLAQGIGNATAGGLNLTTEQFAPSSNPNATIADIAGNVGLGITRPIASNIDVQGLLKQAMSQMPTIDVPAALAAAGRGFGNGATTGLGIAKGQPPAQPAQPSQPAGTPVAPATDNGNNVAPRQANAPAPAPAPGAGIDIPKAVEGFTGGLASSFLGSTDFTRIQQLVGLDTNGVQDMITQQIPQAAIRAAKGLAQGTAQGLGILKAGVQVGQPTFQPGPMFDVPGVAEDFTTSLTSNFLGSANITAVTGNLANAGADQANQLIQSLPAIVQGAGKGFGAGAARGLGLANGTPAPGAPAPVPVSSGTPSADAPPAGVPGAVPVDGSQPGAVAKRQAPAPAPANPAVDPGALAEGFTSSLTENFLNNANLSSLAAQFGMGGGGLALPDTATITSMLAPAAFGLSSGLGEGAAVGLGLKADNGPPQSRNPAGGFDIEQVTRSFGKGLTQEFLANGTVNTLITTLQSQAGGLTNNVDVPAVAEGLARGLVDGAMVGISSVGGINNLISGNFSMPDMLQAPPPDMGPAQFNDSVGGAATALGRGFGSEGVLLVGGLIKSGGVLPQTPPPPAPPAKRSVTMIKTTSERGLKVRQAPAAPPAMSPVVSGALITKGAQIGIDTIGCTGVGGLISIGVGMFETGTIKLDQIPKGLDPQIAALLPEDPITLKLAGNTFEVQAKSMIIKINGLGVIPFAVLTALHVLLVILAFFILLPLFLTLNSLQRIGTLFGKPVGPKSFAWQKRIFFFMYLPTAIVGIVLGIVGKGNSQHLRSSHSIVGMLSLLLTVVGGAVYFLRSKNPKPVEPEVFLPVKQLIKNRPKLTLPVIHGLLLGLLLQVANFAFFSGWTDLANVSFCATEAILSNFIAMSLAVTLMFGLISAFAVVSVRFWLEQRRMARKENGKTVYSVNPEFDNEKGDPSAQSRFSS
ncbi:hypothetical protein HJFPF1_00174 [Paramyrothecium foliicola]|nr:hypothetical protein HJFPF1_00174 [Paramyrothecium foliicola]